MQEDLVPAQRQAPLIQEVALEPSDQHRMRLNERSPSVQL